MLNRLIVRGFKSIEECTLDLTRLNVIIGANGAGKSNLIGVFRFLNAVVAGQMQLYVGEQGGPDRMLFHGEKHTSSMTFRFFSGDAVYGFDLIPAAGDIFIFENERINYIGPPDTVLNRGRSFGHGHRESPLSHEASIDTGGISKALFDVVHNIGIYHFHDTSDSSPLKKTHDIDDNRTFRPDAANLAAFLYWMKLRYLVEYRQVIEHVQLAAPFFDDFVLEPSRNNPNKIKLEWNQKGSDAYFDGYSLSDGTLRFICLATLLLQPDPPSLILLDEPELGLHPFAITLLAEMIEAAATRTQVILATQSVTLLNQFSPESVIVAENDGKRSAFRRLTEQDLSKWLDDYSLGDLWEKNIIGGRP